MRSKMFRALCCIALIIGHFPTCKPDAEWCPSGCKCCVEQITEMISVSCETVDISARIDYSPFPTILPNNTRAFLFRVSEEAHKFNESIISFADKTWGQVEEITIQNVQYLQLHQTRLTGLSRLKVLRLNYDTLINILHPGAFLLTPDVEVLDLSYNPKLPLKSVVAALQKSLSNLKYLDLCNLQADLDNETFILNKEFAMAIENKPLITLNVSNSRISSINDGLTTESIRYLNISNTYGLWWGYRLNEDMCPSLEEFDISQTSFLGKPLGFKTVERSLPCIKLLSSINRLIANNIMATEPIILHDYRLRTMCDTIGIEEMYIRYSNIHIVNITLYKSLLNLKLLDLEGNSMEFLSPQLMQMFPNLQEIYLARNRLSSMANLGDLFESNMVLRVVDLSYNGLQFIPWSMFSHNEKLATLHLQENSLSVFHFSVEKLLNLKILDLRDNMIKYVSRDTIDGIVSIGNQQSWLNITTAKPKIFLGNVTEIVTQMNKTILLGESMTDQLLIDLTGNIMECTCDRIWFNEWLLYTHTFLLNQHLYTCKFDNNLNYMTSKLLNDMQYHCKLKEFIGSIIGIPCSVFLTILLVYVIIRRQRRIKRKTLRSQLLMERYKLNELDDRQRYFVFLSFAGRDAELVNTFIIPELETFVIGKFGNNDNLICTGDSHFTPGRWITEEIDRCLTKCDVIVMVVTNHFIQSEWCRYEVMLAKQKHKSKILLVNEEVYKQKIPSALGTILKVCTRATWRLQNDLFEIRPEWSKIFEGILYASAKSVDEI